MLRASSVEITLTVSDIEEALASLAGGLQDLQVELENGTVLVRHRVSIDRLHVGIRVEMRFHVRAVEGTRVELGVTWSNLGVVPGFLKEIALQKAFESLPGQYEAGIYRIDFAELLEHAPVSFRIKSVQITRAAVRVELADVVAFAFEPAVPEVEPGALVPVPSREEQKIPEHQGFYEALRQKVMRYAADKAPRWAQPLIPWLLAAPDFFVLAVRLARDPRVPASAKVIAGAVIAYFVSPVDLLPDVLPFVGELDDLALALFAVEHIARSVPEDVIQEAWPGEGRVLELVREGIRLITRVLPSKTVETLRRLLG